MSLTRQSLALLAAMAAYAVATGPAAAQLRLNDVAGAQYGLNIRSWRDMPFKTVVRQQYDYSCGSAALATLLHHSYGVPVGEAEIFKAMYAKGDQAQIRKAGFSLLDMKRYLDGRGLRAEGYRPTLTRLAEAEVPAIVVVSNNAYRHFVVVKGIRDGRVLVGDPALGLKTYSADEFKRMWNGVAFVIRGGHDAPTAAFNRSEEWPTPALASLGKALPDGTLAGLTRELSPLYQIAPTLDVSLN